MKMWSDGMGGVAPARKARVADSGARLGRQKGCRAVGRCRADTFASPREAQAGFWCYCVAARFCDESSGAVCHGTSRATLPLLKARYRFVKRASWFFMLLFLLSWAVPVR